MFVDLVEARYIANKVFEKHGWLSTERKKFIVDALEEEDPALAEGLRHVWGLRERA